ncbi:hypothetical protein [Dactylosporangium sp. NPDC050588]|uniref:hypothetical protein n=1 Tax=Dactylosporangium sp. NPDC050588 TaxID=3157211 RepID=UPI003403BCF2
MEIGPAAVVLPKDTCHLQQGRYGPVFPRTPACHGFTIIADVKPGHAEAQRVKAACSKMLDRLQ